MKAGYLTHDVFTNPPTPIQIVSTELLPLLSTEEQQQHHQQQQQQLQQQQQYRAFFITFDDIEPTAGWLADRNNSSLDICFMHSFGKCYGKAKDRDPRTCHQIHVKREVLNRLRQQYTLPHRAYFCRTIKCNVSNDFILRLSFVAKRRLTLQYLEFRTEDVIPTCGSLAYEVEYRNWLFNDNNSTYSTNGHSYCNQNNDIKSNGDIYNNNNNNNNINGNNNNRLDVFRQTPHLTNFISKFNLCYLFSMNGKCEMNSACSDIHVDISKALSKDRTVRFALEQLSRYTTRDLECSQSAPSLLLAPNPTTVISTLTPVNLNNISFGKHFQSNELREQEPVISNLTDTSQQFNLCQPLLLDGNMSYNLPLALPTNNVCIYANELYGNSVEGLNYNNSFNNNINCTNNIINNTSSSNIYFTANSNSQNKQECLCTEYRQNINNNNSHKFTGRSSSTPQIQRLVQLPLQQEEVLCNNQVCHNISRYQEHHTHQHLPYLLQATTSSDNTLLINSENRIDDRYNSCNSASLSTPMFVVDEHGELWLRLASRSNQSSSNNNHNIEGNEYQFQNNLEMEEMFNKLNTLKR